ncbi:Hypothetical protein CINCED_3A015863 [Cinara cedri]|uniref:Tubulin-tyrosine ligase/Tubulin polyglutamylase n=1 Tax=Cinara cedri TaxID=506608 RepID=A0A5E4NF93_9HEMI|nr:Hypothetical protein CINCED_3A015863 [Cinara cedri]
MNNKSYSILTKDEINNEHNGCVPENCFCPLCDLHMNRIKKSRPLDTHQENNAFSIDGIKERRCPIDRLQTIRTNLHQTMDHSSERLLKLPPYPILNTDPTLDNLNFSTTLPKTHSLEPTDRHSEVFQYQNNSKRWEENENNVDQEEFKNIDQFNYTPIKKYDKLMRHGIKERRCPIDRLQSLRTNLHQTMDHSLERLLKLPPYPILDTDPTLDNLNFSTTLPKTHSLGNKIIDYATQSMYDIEPTDRHNEVFPYHNNSRRWEENKNNIDQEKFKNIDQFNYTPIKKYDKLMRQPPVHRQRKLLPTVPPKPLNCTNSVVKTGGSSGITNGHLNSQNSINKDLMNIPNQKCLLNHVGMSTMPEETKESLMATNDDNGINISDPISPKTESILKNNDNFKKEQVNLSDRNNKKLTLKTRKRVEILNNTTVFPVNSLNNHLLNSSVELTSENTQTNLKSTIVQIPNQNLELDHIPIEQNNLGFDHMFSDPQNRKSNSEQHSALRSSLFSNVPPYIRFTSHDVKGESFPLPLQRLLKWKLSSITPIVVRRTIQNSGFKLVRKSNDWFGTWGKHMKSLCFKTLREQQKFNHFPGTFQIGRKDRLWINLHRLMLKYGKNQFGFIPTSYILPQEATLLRKVWDECGNDGDKWIVKPPASARGTGIRVISKWNQIPKKVPLVVQRYIDNPYLINDTKFDLRLYILITSINPLRLYLYDNGLVRFASVKYSSDLNTISDRYMHLTNYSINRLSSQYTQNEDADACQGHKWTLKSLWSYMEKERKIEVKKLWESLADLVVKTVISGESPMSQMCRSNLSNRYNAYELFGIDVLFDEYLKPWILEVNISPSLHSSSPLDLAVKGPLVKDLMNMVGYHIPNKMSPSTQNTLMKTLGVHSPLCYDKRLYTFNLSAKERDKQEYYTNVESREEYINSILDDLLPDDVRHLIAYEDELTQVGSFQKVFPTTSSFKYHQYFDGPRYYNMLFDAWECKYSNKREEGIAMLDMLCQSKVHLEVPDNDEEQSKIYDTLQNTQMEVEKMFEKTGSDKISDHHQAVIR